VLLLTSVQLSGADTASTKRADLMSPSGISKVAFTLSDGVPCYSVICKGNTNATAVELSL